MAKVANYCQLWLTCRDKTEAGKIADSLLKKRLIACARQVPVNSAYRWKGKIDSSKEIMLLMESRTDLFDEIEAEVKKLYSYDTFVLGAVTTSKVSKNAGKWLRSELKHGS